MNLIKIDFLFLDLYFFTRFFKGIVDFDFIRMIKLLIIIKFAFFHQQIQ